MSSRINSLAILLVLLVFFKTLHNVKGQDYYKINSHEHFARVALQQGTDLLNITDRCKRELVQYGAGLVSFQLWALKMFDAGSKFPSGLLDGNFVDLGHFDECINIETNVTSGKYCLGLVLKVPKPNPIVLPPVFSTCLPSACSTFDLQMLYKAFSITAIFPEEACNTKESSPKLNVYDIVVITCFCIVLVLVVLSTVYEVVLHYSKKEPHHSILLAFSLLSNVKTLVTCSNRKNEISCIHGIRVISMFWIMVSHKGLTGFLPVHNYFEDIRLYYRRYTLIMYNAYPALDTFFLIGGLLVVYSYHSERKRNIPFNIVHYYVHRYIRLTSLVIIVMIFYLTLLIHIGSGPVWSLIINEMFVTKCRQFWWAALLQIQNFAFLVDKPCILQSWYISLDFQLFLLSPLVLIPLLRWPQKTIATMVASIIIIQAAVFSYSWILKIKIWIGYRMDADDITRDALYIRAVWTKAVPWLFGIILGHILLETRRKALQVRISIVQALLFWLISIGVLYLCTFQAFNIFLQKRPQLDTSLYLTFCTPAWSIALCWIIYACCTGYGGVINWFLSLPFFQVLSKLSFSIYLVHLAVIMFLPGQTRRTIEVNDLKFWHSLFGDAVVAIFVSAVVFLMFEMPIANMEKHLWNKKPPPPPTKIIINSNESNSHNS